MTPAGGRNRAEVVGVVKIEDKVPGVENPGKGEGGFWESFSWIVGDAWAEGDLTFLETLEERLSEQVTRGSAGHIAAFCLEYVRAARDIAEESPAAGAMVSRAAYNDLWL